MGNLCNAVPIFGGTMTGLLVLSADPVAALGAVTKQYADAIAAGLEFKNAVVAASTGALTATYANGVAGVGATLTNAGAMAAFSLDGQSPTVGQRVLIKDQASTFENGIYTVTTVGSGAVNWVLTRGTDYDQASEIHPGDLIPVTAGTLNSDTFWVQTATVAVIGTDAISFSQFSSAPVTYPISLANGGTGASLVASNGGIFYSTGAAGAILAGTATANQVLLSGSSAAPAWSTATYPATSTINQLLYSSSNNVIAGLATTNRASLATSSAGVPQWLALTDGQIVIGSTAGAPAAGSISGGANISVTPGSNSISIAVSGVPISTSVDQSSSTVTLAAGRQYTINNGASLVTLTLPTTAAIGDTFRIVGGSSGGWIIAQNANQILHVGSTASTTGVGGSVASSNRYDCVTLTCIVANLEWSLYGIQGNLTVV